MGRPKKSVITASEASCYLNEAKDFIKNSMQYLEELHQKHIRNDRNTESGFYNISIKRISNIQSKMEENMENECLGIIGLIYSCLAYLGEIGRYILSPIKGAADTLIHHLEEACKSMEKLRDLLYPPVNPVAQVENNGQPNDVAQQAGQLSLDSNTSTGSCSTSDRSLSERVTTSSTKNGTIFEDKTPKTIDLMPNTMSSEDPRDGNKGKHFVEEKVLSAFSKEEDEEDDTRYDKNGDPDNYLHMDNPIKEKNIGYDAREKLGAPNPEDYDPDRIDPTSSMRYGDPEQTYQPINLFNKSRIEPSIEGQSFEYHNALPSLVGAHHGTLVDLMSY